MSDKNQHKDSTLAALLRERPKRGRPRREVPRQNVYVELSKFQKRKLKRLAGRLPDGYVRADIPDLAIMLLATRLEELRRAVAGRSREIPEGVTDLESLYLLWDLPLPEADSPSKWTSIRVSPQQAIDLGRAHGTLNVLFGANRSQVFSLALALLKAFVENDIPRDTKGSLVEMRRQIASIYL